MTEPFSDECEAGGTQKEREYHLERLRNLWRLIRRYDQEFKHFHGDEAQRWYEAIALAAADIEKMSDGAVATASRRGGWLKEIVRQKAELPAGEFNIFLDGMIW